jgi:hypothetical protein
MKRTILLGTVFAILFFLCGLPLMAQGGMGAGQAGGPPPDLEQRGINNRIDIRGDRNMAHHKTAAQLLAENANLSEKVQTLLPAGEKVQDAATGFNDLEEFVAAVHIAHNMNIPFNQLKGKIKEGDSLDKALRKLNQSLSRKEIKSEVKKGKKQAKEDIHASHA